VFKKNDEVKPQWDIASSQPVSPVAWHFAELKEESCHTRGL
jgi:hypothetical protein